MGGFLTYIGRRGTQKVELLELTFRENQLNWWWPRLRVRFESMFFKN